MTANTALIFCVGRELLEGLVLDRNANFMASQVSEAGCHVRSIQVLDDEKPEMIAAFRAALATKPSFIFTTGGMGPGHDDFTRECMAEAAAVPLIQDKHAVEMLEKSYRRLHAKGIIDDPEVNEVRLGMANVPQGSMCYENPIGTAPAVRLRIGGTLVFMLPGVPEEMQGMFRTHVLPAMKSEGPGTSKRSVHIDYPGRDESAISRLLADLTRRHTGVRSKARLQGSPDSMWTQITLFGEHTDSAELDSLLARAEADLRARLGLEIQTPVADDATAD